MTVQSYQSATFNLSGLTGISDQTLEMHFDLYQGYVKNTNLLNEQLMALQKKNTPKGSDPHYAELVRRLGFEYGGMVLHEYYFANLAPQSRDQPSQQLQQALQESFGGYDAWKAAFVAVGGMRGIGWAILYQDPATGQLSNHWVSLHQNGVPSGFHPIVVMDVWEHAYLLDYKPTEKEKYIEAFFANMNWQIVNQRLTQEVSSRAIAA
jgi:superoxide dismutase, Fe-Mn family